MADSSVTCLSDLLSDLLSDDANAAEGNPPESVLQARLLASTALAQLDRVLDDKGGPGSHGGVDWRWVNLMLAKCNLEKLLLVLEQNFWPPALAASWLRNRLLPTDLVGLASAIAVVPAEVKATHARTHPREAEP